MLYQGGVKISNETLLSQVPFIDDVKKEIKRIEVEQQADVNSYAGAFGGNNNTLVTKNQQDPTVHE